MLPVRAYLLVALVIALLAFGMGQLVPGLGIGFVALSSMLWVAYAVDRERRFRRSR